jgi:hypothetical protein
MEKKDQDESSAILALTKAYGKPILTHVIPNDEKSEVVKTWNTPHGVIFKLMTMSSFGLMIYEYDSTLESIAPDGRESVISFKDVVSVIDQLLKNPDKLRTKPRSIKRIEEQTGYQAVRKRRGFGKWHLYVGNVSMFCNPFSTELGYTSSEDEFEVWFRGMEQNPRQYQSTEEVLEGLTEFDCFMKKMPIPDKTDLPCPIQ